MMLGAAIFLTGLELSVVPCDRIVDRLLFDGTMPRHLVWLSSWVAMVIGAGLFIDGWIAP